MKPLLILIATAFVAPYGVSTRAMAESVYRCDNRYSQTPCPDGVRVEVQDRRTAEQKAQTDAATRRDTQLANALERTRLQEEASREKALNKARAVSARKKPANQPTAYAERKRKKGKKPTLFAPRGTPTPPKSSASQAL